MVNETHSSDAKETNGKLDGIDERLKIIDDHIDAILGVQEKQAISLARLDERMKASESDRKLLHEELSVNTQLIKSIKDDTALMVRISRGARALKLFLIWAAPVVSVIITAYVTWTMKK